MFYLCQAFNRYQVIIRTGLGKEFTHNTNYFHTIVKYWKVEFVDKNFVMHSTRVLMGHPGGRNSYYTSPASFISLIHAVFVILFLNLEGFITIESDYFLFRSYY